MAIFFLDLEASSLDDGSFPIEIAWIDAQGLGETYLIQPQWNWTDWSPASEKIHGISRAELVRDGQPAAEVAHRASDALDGHLLCSDNPAFDQYWLGMLLHVIDRPPLAMVDLIAVLRAEIDSAPDHEAAIQHLLRTIEDESRRQRVRHRALPDAEGMHWCWQQVRDTVRGVG